MRSGLSPSHFPVLSISVVLVRIPRPCLPCSSPCTLRTCLAFAYQLTTLPPPCTVWPGVVSCLVSFRGGETAVALTSIVHQHHLPSLAAI
ncbi:hypothetical protein LX32DRAFT_252644 [Colletotrichum zoysiae]|uniref:Uncharacterized protein n=1 Tax=Colletotrichum zoysiae TaxID=1216348 RepID=A0AAD9HTL7_9PEZI|nr:hypothetical protein LX32DRAFT_252644 [Colletotrichum zoysiae]